jgi:F0F1-type ATP synthase assembly protein I
MSSNEIDPPADAPAPSADMAAKRKPEPKPAMPKPKHDPLYFVVVLLLIADIVFGLGLAVFADKVIDFRPMAMVGLGLAGLGLGILAYFVLFGSGKPRK